MAKNYNIYWNIYQGAWRWLITNSDGQGDVTTFTQSSLCGRPVWFTRVKYVKTACFSSRACGAGNFTCAALHKHFRKMYLEYYGIRQTISCWQNRQKWKTINQPVINKCAQKERQRESALQSQSQFQPVTVHAFQWSILTRIPTIRHDDLRRMALLSKNTRAQLRLSLFLCCHLLK